MLGATNRSLRNGGMGLPELIGKYLGGKTRSLMLVFTVLLLIVLGAVMLIFASGGLWRRDRN